MGRSHFLNHCCIGEWSWVRHHISPVSSASIGISSSSSPPHPSPSSDPSSVHLNSYSSSSSSSPFPAPLIIFSLAAPPSRRSWSAASGHQYLIYSSRVVCTAPSMSATNQAQRLMLPQASVSVYHVTSRTHLVRRRQIISPMLTRQTPVALSRSMRQHDIIARMDSQGGACYLATLTNRLYPPGGVLTLRRIGCISP